MPEGEKQRSGSHEDKGSPPGQPGQFQQVPSTRERLRKFTSKCSKAQGLAVRSFRPSLRSGLPGWHLTHKESSVHVCLNK